MDRPEGYIPSGSAGRAIRTALFGAALAGASMESMWGDGPVGIDPLEGIDIDAEYELIKQKKSTLSAKMRALVIRRKELA